MISGVLGYDLHGTSKDEKALRMCRQALDNANIVYRPEQMADVCTEGGVVFHPNSDPNSDKHFKKFPKSWRGLTEIQRHCLDLQAES